jgi:hypothetical protein
MGWLGNDSQKPILGYAGDPPPTDYYNKLVDGMLSGHLYMNVQPDPDLLSPDPEVRRRAPTLLDAGFYRGHYYLYYGITPAVLAFLPYTWATARHLSPNSVTWLFSAAGFLYSLMTLRMFLRERRLQLPPSLDIMLVLLLAFATGTPALIVRSEFYEVPVAAGYACAMGACYHLCRARLAQAVRGFTSASPACCSVWP